MDDQNITPMFVSKCIFLSLQTDVIVESKHEYLQWNRFAFPSQNMSKRHPTQETPIHIHQYEMNEKRGQFHFQNVFILVCARWNMCAMTAKWFIYTIVYACAYALKCDVHQIRMEMEIES